jgi:D-glycero-D-manno-heptose 1,7-bisphosphate phosphatase
MGHPIFLDRDGVINIEPSLFGKDYITEPQEFQFISNSILALKLLVENNYDIYVISNQAGVGKGIFSIQQLNQVTEYMIKVLRENGIEIKEILYCPHRSEDNCNCRKPKTGNLEKVWDRYPGLRKDRIFFIGDQERDIQTAKNFSILSILVLSGKADFSSFRDFSILPDYIAYNLYDAVTNVILR